MSKSKPSAAPAPKQATSAPVQAAAAGPAQTHEWAELQQRLGNRALYALLHSAASGRGDPLENAADGFADASSRTSAAREPLAEANQRPTPGSARDRSSPARRKQAEQAWQDEAEQLAWASPVMAQPPARLVPRLRQVNLLPVAALGRMLGHGGETLPGALRRDFEARLGLDLRSVRIHSGTAAQTLSRMLGARAFTLGQDIVLGAGAPSAASASGHRLLAHEVAHVAQQAHGLLAARSPLNDALADLARVLSPHGRFTIQRQPNPTPSPASGTTAVSDDPAFDAGIDRRQAPAKNLEWWNSLDLAEVNPLRHLDPEHHPHAFANRVRRAQELMQSSGLARVEGARLRPDGILGPRTFLALLAVARDDANTARAAIQGLGFDLDAIAVAEDTELLARAYARVPETVLQTPVEVLGESAVRYYDIFYSMISQDREVFDHAVFGDQVPPDLRREDRIEMLHRLYGSREQRLQGALEVVQARRDFIDARIDVGRAVTRDRRRGTSDGAYFTFVAISPSRASTMMVELGVRPALDRAIARQSPDESLALQAALTLLAAQTEGPAAGAPQMAAFLMALYLPTIDEAERRAVTDAVLAARGERERVERERVEQHNREGAHQRADLLVDLINDDRTNHIIVESRLVRELERAVGERMFFDLVLDDLAARPGDMFNRLFSRVEAISGDYAIGLLVQAARGGRYAGHARVRQAQAELIRRHGGMREHGYEVDASGDATRGAVLVEGDQRVAVGQVAGDINGAYLRDEDREQLKPDAQRRLQAALEECSRAYMARLLEGIEPARTQDEIGRLLVQQAWTAAQLDPDRDIEDVEWQESVRVKGVRRAADRGDGVPRYEVDYERVQRILGGEAGDTDWQPIEGSRGWRSESEFEYDMFWYPYSQMADVMETAAIVVTVGAVIVVAWEVGVIAALVSAGGGAIPVGLSIGISLAIYMLTHERWTLSGLLLAGIEGYLGAVGFRLFAPVGAAVGRMVIPATLEQVTFRRVVAAWLLRHGTVGALTGGTLGPASLFMQDLVRVAGTGGGFSSFAAYLRSAGTGMLLGAMFEIGGSALLAPLFRNADSSVLARVDDVVATLNGTQPRLTASQWFAHAGACLSATREFLATIMTEVNARGVYAVLRERMEQVGSAWLAGARGTLHREVIEMAGARMSREAMDGLERLLRLGSARLGDDALATLLQQARRTPERIDPWLRFFSGLDEAATADLVARGQLRPLLDAEQTLALALRRTPAEMNTLLGGRFAHSVADLDAFATRLNRLEHAVGDNVLEALRTRGTAVTPRALVRVAEAGHALDDELLGGMQRMLDGADHTRLEALLEAMADDQVGAFLRQAQGAAPPELEAMRRVVATHDAPLVAWGVRLPIHQAETLLDALSAAAREVITDIPATEAERLVVGLGIGRVNRALGGGTAGPMRGAHLLALEQQLHPRSVIDMLDAAGGSAARLRRVANIAAGLEPAAARLPATPVGAASLLLDSNARSAVDELVRGVSKNGRPINVFADLDENYRDAIDAIRESRGLPRYVDPPGGARPTVDQVVGPGADLRASPVAGAETVTSETISGRASQVLPQMGGIRPNRAHADYTRVVDELQARGVGGPGGGADRVVISDAMFSERAGGAVPRLVSVDESIATRLAENFSVAPRNFAPPRGADRWQALVARYPEGAFTIEIFGHRLEIAFHGATGRPPVPP